MAIFDNLKRFDAYPKTLDDFRVKTFSGAAVSIIAIIIMVILFSSELVYFLSTDVHEELFVDTARNEKLRINLDITFPKMPCVYLSLDVMDISGENEQNIDHDVFRQRLDASGNKIYNGQEEIDELGESHADNVADKALDGLKDLDPNRCESCYGAEDTEGQCCNTCAQVQEAYRKKGWAFRSGQGIAQCEREGYDAMMEAQEREGCQLYGHLEVNKVAGNFHIAPGRSFEQHNMHIHDMQSFGREKLAKFNLTHVINHLSFGIDYPDRVNSLDGHVEVPNEYGAIMYQYFLKVVPTRYRFLSQTEIDTNQYSVTMHQREIRPDQGTSGLPGLFFMYDISPMKIQLTQSSRSFFHFLTGLCAIIGGVYTVAGMIDGFLYHGIRTLKAKQNMGKLG
ncbi:uncharacterized protein MONBRDRAFT_34133 [Monosiga brevicollis MX1]|uniref:Endoplasmic reticulum-Golgi intermediate compartment protein 3 n=1 Tax=Monosiga brevicollis TaxID=81824 RepID=A9V9S2_MONBE|nr:uncharacterized protein MONBRDRAFT_34133 [Monosiga brevicollis MX1]EDQ85716.1 predicted protein [Monosiga brevicollis MX1]|eukprot:XP_001749431.1 hypothetical protein [Monosiga brevicollis MX1]